ncbi:MAG: FAD-binding oxidoreductase [Deltaproteobacteria bacterium]|nr:FAD-binding oxidoreductase [Deltaproteobacteria bacterium]
MPFSDIAFKALQDIAGKENVTNDPLMCQAYSRIQWTPDGVIQREQIGLAMRPACVVMPGSTEEVQAIFKTANSYLFPVIPMGTGMINSAFPNREGTVLIDPKRMDRIIKIDAKNMYAVIEPYVTFASLQAEVMKVGLSYPSPPAGSQISVLANISWHGGYGNSWISGLGAQMLLGFELVLPNGELLKSGSVSQTGSDWIWNDGPGPDLRGFLRGAQFGHAGGMGMVTKASTRLFPWPGPQVFPTEGHALEKLSEFSPDKFRWYMIDFPHNYPKEEEYALKKACDFQYELSKAEIGAVVQHLAKQFLLSWSSRTKKEFHEGMARDIFPHGYNVVGLCTTTSLEQLEYEEKVLRYIVAKQGGTFLTEEDEPYRLWMNIANDWIRTGHSMRLSRPSDSFHQGTACLDSIDNVAKEIVRANQTQRELYEKEGIGKGLLQPISQHGGWISPLERGYGAVMTTDLWPEQTPQQAAECISLLFGSLKGMLQEKSAGATLALLGPAYDLLGPRFFNVHLIVKEIKKTFDPNNISNPPYPTRPDVVPPQELAEMTKVL